MKYLIVLASITLGAVGQLFLKMAAINTVSRVGNKLTSYYINLLGTPFTYLGAISYGFSFLIWMLLLKKYDLSFLRPLVGFGYILTSILAFFFLKEKISMLRWIGIALIVSGVYIVGISSKS